jgi:hypothetical protein
MRGAWGHTGSMSAWVRARGAGAQPCNEKSLEGTGSAAGATRVPTHSRNPSCQLSHPSRKTCTRFTPTPKRSPTPSCWTLAARWPTRPTPSRSPSRAARWSSGTCALATSRGGWCSRRRVGWVGGWGVLVAGGFWLFRLQACVRWVNPQIRSEQGQPAPSLTSGGDHLTLTLPPEYDLFPRLPPPPGVFPLARRHHDGLCGRHRQRKVDAHAPAVQARPARGGRLEGTANAPPPGRSRRRRLAGLVPVPDRGRGVSSPLKTPFTRVPRRPSWSRTPSNPKWPPKHPPPPRPKTTTKVL